VETRLQWGCAFSSAEIDYLLAEMEYKSGLQWGCAFSSAEIPSLLAKQILAYKCFNGAALFQAQKS